MISNWYPIQPIILRDVVYLPSDIGIVFWIATVNDNNN